MIQPVAQLSDQVGLAQKQMPAGPDLEAAIPGYCRSRIAQFRRIEQRSATIALIAACGVVPTMRTGADDVAIGEEASVRGRPYLLDLALLDEPGGIKSPVKMLCQRVVLYRR